MSNQMIAAQRRSRKTPFPYLTKGLLVGLLALALAGCGGKAQPVAGGQAPNQDAAQLAAELERLSTRNKELETKLNRMTSQLAEAEKSLDELKATKGAVVNLINETYLNEKVDEDPLTYKKVAMADLDGDGTEEKIIVATTAQADPKTGEFAWDDGHPWYVYVDEADGTRTTLFANWVQLGRLRVVVGEEPTSLIIASEQGAGTTIYRVTYKGPKQTEAMEMASYLTGVRPTFPPGANFID